MVDAAKAIAHEMGAWLISVPTVASTNATATFSASIEGDADRNVWYVGPHTVIADTRIIAQGGGPLAGGRHGRCATDMDGRPHCVANFAYAAVLNAYSASIMSSPPARPSQLRNGPTTLFCVTANRRTMRASEVLRLKR